MKYKLLTEKGIHFVCLGDGTKIPCQELSTIRQEQRLPASVDVVALCRTDRNTDWLMFKDGGLYLGEKRLLNLNKVWFVPDFEMHNSGLWGRCYFTVEVEPVETVERPKPVLS